MTLETPDFIIGGAPKCGTTSLHQVLDQHPGVWMAKNELYFFDADDPIAHRDFFEMDGEDLVWRDPKAPALRNWYHDRFSEAPDGCLIGEDTTTYLMSDVAAFRIGAAAPAVKVVFMLRDPVERAFSQYWHLVRSGRTCLSFEKALSEEPSIILGSTYAPALRQFFSALGKDRVHVVLFEEFKTNQQAAMDGVANFLGIPNMSLDEVETWHNRTKYPARTKTLLHLNRVGRVLVRYRYARHFGDDSRFLFRVANKAYWHWFRFVAKRVLTEDKPPSSMRPKTRAYLCHHLSDRNAGLSELLDVNLANHWPGFFQ